MYMEQIIIAQDKKLKKTIDLFDINSYEELTNDTGAIYAKRCLLEVRGEAVLVAMSYKDVNELVRNLNIDNKIKGFGRDSKKA